MGNLEVNPFKILFFTVFVVISFHLKSASSKKSNQIVFVSQPDGIADSCKIDVVKLSQLIYDKYAKENNLKIKCTTDLNYLSRIRHLDYVSDSTRKSINDCILVTYFIGKKKSEVSIYKFSLSSKSLVSCFKDYISNINLNDSVGISDFLYEAFSHINKKYTIYPDSKSEFEISLAREDQIFFDTLNSHHQKAGKFCFYNIEDVNSPDVLKKVIGRFIYFTDSLDENFPFETPCANLYERFFVSDDLYRTFMRTNFPQSYFLLMAADNLRLYLQKKDGFKKNIQNESEKIEAFLDSLNGFKDSLELTDEETAAWKNYGIEFEIELIKFIKIKEKIINGCETYDSELSALRSCPDYNIRIAFLIGLLSQKCPYGKDELNEALNSKRVRKLNLMDKLDTASIFLLEYLYEESYNHIALNKYLPNLRISRFPGTEEIKTFLDTLAMVVNKDPVVPLSIEFKVDTINEKEFLVLVNCKKKEISMYGSGFPLGKPWFNGINEFYEFTYNMINSIGTHFDLKAKAITVMGASDRTPFKGNKSYSPTDRNIYKKYFQLVCPLNEITKLYNYNLSENFGKNVTLALERGFLLERFLVQKGINEQIFNLIEVCFYDKSTGSTFRSCGLSIVFHSNQSHNKLDEKSSKKK